MLVSPRIAQDAPQGVNAVADADLFALFEVAGDVASDRLGTGEAGGQFFISFGVPF